MLCAAGKSVELKDGCNLLSQSHVSVVGRPLSRLLDTDLWFVTDMMDSGTPMFYAFFPSVAGVAKGRFADPLNPRRFAVPDDVLAALPADLKGDNSQWLTSKGYPVRYVEVAGGRHDPVHWRAQFPDGILFLAGKNAQSK